MQWTQPALHTLVTALPESWLLQGTYATASLGRSCRYLFGAGLNANAASSAGFWIDHRHVVFHVNSVERACYFTVAVTNASEIALVRAAKRYRGRLASVKPDVRMLLLDFAVVSGASEVRDHATSSARGFAGDLRYFFCHLLLPWGTLTGRAIRVDDTGFCIRFAPGESTGASVSTWQTSPYRLDLGIDLYGKLLGDERQSRAGECTEYGKENYPYQRYGPNILHALAPQEKTACSRRGIVCNDGNTGTGFLRKEKLPAFSYNNGLRP